MAWKILKVETAIPTVTTGTTAIATSTKAIHGILRGACLSWSARTTTVTAATFTLKNAAGMDVLGGGGTTGGGGCYPNTTSTSNADYLSTSFCGMALHGKHIAAFTEATSGDAGTLTLYIETYGGKGS